MNRKNGLLFFIALLAIPIILIGIYKFFVSPIIRPQPIPLTGMRTYTDPDNYFSINIPMSWQVNKSDAMGMTNVGAPNQKTQKIEVIDFNSSNGIAVGVQVYEGKPLCGYRSDDNATLAGLPAVYDSTNGTWTLDTERATFGVNYGYPGAPIVNPGGLLNLPTLSPLQISSEKVNQQLVNTIINTFHPKDLHALNC